MREITGRMIITHEQLTLLENIGQVVVHIFHTGEFGIVYKANLASRHFDAGPKRLVAVKTLTGRD